MQPPKRKKIAIIGTGISGLSIAHLLAPYHAITVYEKNDYIGGHSRTLEVKTSDGLVSVDTGFIVFNNRNYPQLSRLFNYLKVPTAKSDMSFGASISNGWLEYGTQKLSNIFAQKRNLLRPSFLKMVLDILKFNATAKKHLSKEPSFPLSDSLSDLKMGPWFQNYFLLPMGGAIWSTPISELLNFPACSFIRFFENHGLLTIKDHPTWYTVKGGSKEYVKRLIAPFKDSIFINRAVKKVWREEKKAFIEDIYGVKEEYDEIVFACHADQSAALIQDPSVEEVEILSPLRYQDNRVVLHSDLTFMPKKKAAWASWIYLSEGKRDTKQKISLSYWMNNLQPLNTKQPLILTLNPGRPPDPSLIHNEYTFEHPVFDAKAITAQSRIEAIQGKNLFWFCGAYQQYGFHEDGLMSSIKVANKMGICTPW